MLIATGKLDTDNIIPRLPWYRIPLFWHYGLSGKTRLTIASAAFLILWLTPIISNRRKDARRIIMGATLIILILFGSSTATTIYSEHHINQMVISNE
jgi:hypothetical protein